MSFSEQKSNPTNTLPVSLPQPFSRTSTPPLPPIHPLHPHALAIDDCGSYRETCLDANDGTAAVRCCSLDGTSFISVCGHMTTGRMPITAIGAGFAVMKRSRFARNLFVQRACGLKDVERGIGALEAR